MVKISIWTLVWLFAIGLFFSARAQVPTVSSVTPNIAPPGSSVTITGTNFNTTPANNIVYFGATKATVTTASATSLTVTVPTGATYMPVSVNNTASALTGYSQYPFLPTYDNSAYIPGTVNMNATVDFTTGTQPFSVAIGDLDGDGKADLAVANTSSTSVSVFRNTGSSGAITSGSFAAKVDFATGTSPRSVAIGDLDGDGKADLAVANHSSNTVSVFRNTSSSGAITSGSFAAKVDFSTGTDPVSVSIGDLDGDGKADLAVANRSSITVSVFRNTSSSGAITTSSFAAKVDFTTGMSPNSVAIGDLDGDGKADMAVANYNSHTVSVFRNISSIGALTAGSFAAKVDFTTGTYPLSVAIGDLDGDGKADMAVANFTATSVSVFRNTSSSGAITTSSFAAKVDFTTGPNPHSVAIGDLDGDGKADMAVANTSSTSVSVFRNTGSSGAITSGSFAAKVDFATGTSPRSVAIGDLDGDGKADLAVTNSASHTVSVIRNSPLSSITGTASVCLGATTTLANTTTGGTWSSALPAVATVGSTGIVTGVSAGTAVISYTVAGGSVTTVVTVNPPPNAGTITGSSSVCVGNTITLSSTASGGAWTSSNSAIATVGATGIVTGVAGGSVTISYSIPIGCFSVKSVTVNPVPTAIIGADTACVGSSTTLINYSGGGSWSSGNPSVATINPESGILTGMSSGSSLISYTLITGCRSTMEFTVHGLPLLSGDSSACIGALTTLIGTPTGGTWTSSNPSIATIGLLSGNVSALAGGYSTLVYTLPTSCSVTKTFVVNPLPAVAGGSDIVYIGFPVTLSGGAYGLWSSSNTAIANVGSVTGIVTGLTPGTAVISYTLTHECGTSIASHAVTVLEQPDIAVTSTPAVCAGDTTSNIDYSIVSGSPFTYSINWSDSAKASGFKNTTSSLSVVGGDGGWGYFNEGGLATASNIVNIRGVAVDASGNIYLTDYLNNRVRKVSYAGIITNFAGNGTYGDAGDGGPATAAQLATPRCLSTDAMGNLYITDDYFIRKVAPDGTISRVAGTGTSGYSGDGGPATAAQLNNPAGTVSDAAGNLYIADAYNFVVRKVNIGGIITTVAGTGIFGTTGDGGPATAARLRYPISVAVDGTGNLFIRTDLGVRKVSPYGIISNYAGNGSSGYSGDGGPATAAALNGYRGMVIDSLGNLYLSHNNSIRKVSSTGIIDRIAGLTESGFSGDGGLAINAKMYNANDVAIDASGQLYIADLFNGRVRKVSTDGIISTVAGGGIIPEGVTATSVGFTDISSVATDVSGNIYVATTGVINKISRSGILTRVAGTGVVGYSGDGGTARDAKISTPNSLAFDVNGNIFFSDLNDFVIRKISPLGVITTVAGNNAPDYWTGGEGVPATSVGLVPNAVTVDNSGNLYIANNTMIKKVTTDGYIYTIAGSSSWGYSGDGGPASAATFSNINSIAVDDVGNLYIADRSNYVVRKITTDGIITTIAGTGTYGSSGDGGPATAATLFSPSEVKFDKYGNLLINTDYDIRVVSPAGIISTLSLPDAGLGFYNARIATEATGNLILGDNNARLIRRIKYDTALTTSPIMLKIPTSVAANTYIGYLSVFDTSGGFTTDTISITISPSAGPITGTKAICSGNSTTLSVPYLGGIWTSSNGEIATVDSIGNVSGGTAGTTIITYQLSSTCGLTSATTVVTVNETPTITLDTMPTVCVGITETSFGYSTTTVSPLSYSIKWDSSAEAVGFSGTPYIITTIAGNSTPSFSGDGGPATAAGLGGWPEGVAVDGNGNVYVATGNSTLRKITPEGIITTIAGDGSSSMTHGGDGGPATAAGIINSYSAAVDAAGNIYIAEFSANVIRKVTPEGIINTVAGNYSLGSGYSGDGGPATAATLSGPTDIACDAAGNLYIADQYNNVVRMVTTDGIITTVAGNGSYGTDGDGGAATAAALYSPSCVALDQAGNLYVGQAYMNVIRKITASGIITTYAGGDTCSWDNNGDGGAATAACINSPQGLSTDNFGNLYIAEGNVIRKVNSAGIISTFAGTFSPYGGGYSGDNGPATAAQLNYTTGVASDIHGNVYVSEYNNGVIRKVSNITSLLSSPISQVIPPSAAVGSYNGELSVYNGSCSSTYPISVSLAPSAGPLSGQTTVCTGNTTTLVVPYLGGTWTSSNPEVATVGGSGIVNGLVSGTTTISYQLLSACGTTGADVTVTVNETPTINLESIPPVILGDTTALIPYTVITGSPQYSLVWDSAAQASGFVGTPAHITTIAGGGSDYISDGIPATSSGLSAPIGMVVDGAGNLFIVEPWACVVRKITPSGLISLVAGTYGSPGYSGDGGPATAATLNWPSGVTIDAAGNLFIADYYNNAVRKVSTDGIITTVAGGPTTGYSYSGDGGPATAAGMFGPRAVTVDVYNNLYISDYFNNVVRKVTTSGIISTYAGNGGYGYSGDGGPATSALLAGPTGMTVGDYGDLYVSDGQNNVIRKIDGSGIISTFAGNNTLGYTYSGDGGPATASGMYSPSGLGFDGYGNLYIADNGNNTIRKVSTSGIISTVAGNNTLGGGFSGDGGLATSAQVYYPEAVTFDPTGNLYIADYGNNLIRKVTSITTLPSSPIVVSVPTAASVGTYHASLTVYNGQCTNAYPVDLTVTLLLGTITGTSTLCPTTSIILSADVDGGAWSSSNNSVAIIGSTTGVVTGIASGTATITYTLAGSIATTVITVNPLPSPGVITGISTLCAGSNTTFSNSISDGLWSSSDMSIVSVGSTGIVTGVNAGTATISYTVTNGCGSTSSTLIVTVNPLPNPGTITGSSSVCAGSTTTLSNATSGSTWSSSNTSVATVGSTGIVIGVASGTTTISYSATNGCGTVSATKIITVNSTPSSGTITGSSSVCVGNTITLSSTASGGAWTSSNSAIATVGTTGIVTGVASGATTISYTVSNECGSATATKAITVNPLPNAGTITGASTVNAGATITLSNTTTGGTWSSSTTTVATVGSTGVLSGVAAGVTTISYTVTNACGSAVATKVVTVNAVLETPITGTLTLCEGSNTTLSNATSGGAWSSSNTMKATVSSEGIVSGVSAGTAIISYTISGSTVTAVVTVNALPTVGTFTGSSTACVGGTLTLYNSVPGGTWSSSSDGATVSSTGEVTGVAEGYAIISYTVSNECGESVATKDILILSTPDAGTLSGTANICVGATTALSSSVSGGTWSSGYTAVATVDASGLVTGVGAGTATISYRMTNFCGTSYATQVVTVNPLPNAGTIGGANAVCVGATATMPFISAAGVWSSSDPSIATINSSRVVTGVAAGVVTISHTVTNSCGTDVATKVMTVNPLPVAGTLSGATVVCAGANIAITPSVSGGTWLSSNASIASVSTSGEVTGVSAGVVTISYRVTNSCGIATATQAITVNPAVAVAAIGGLSSLCAGSTIALTNATAGGTWSSSNTSAATISSSGIVTGVAEGSTTISYTVSNSCGTATATKAVTVNPLPVAGTISGASTLCTGSTITLSSTGTGGSWISGTPSVATISSEGVVSGIAAGVSIMTYRVINGCGTANATFAVTVSAAPTIAAISGPSLVCAGNNITLSNTTSGGTWVSSETSIATISSTGIVTGVAAGTSTISYVRTNGCGTVASTKEVTVLAQPVAGTLSGSNSLCVGATSVFSSTESGGTWSSSYPAGANVNSSTGLVTGVAVGSFIISYRMTNSCGTVYATRTVTVSPVPNAGTIGGANVVCVGATTTMPFISAAGVWSSSDPSVATINSSRVVTGVAVGIVTISHTVTTGCGSAVATKVITVNPLPVAGTLSGVSVVCVGNTATITPSVTGGTWSSNNPTKASVTTAGVVTGVSAGSAVISYRITNSCGIATATHAVTVNPAVTVAAIGGSSSLCAGNTLTLTNTTTGGTWSSSNTSVATIGSTGIVTGVSQGVTTISYVISSSCGAAIATKTITVNPLPVAGTISGATSMCISTTTTLSTTGTGGTWISGNTGLATINSSGLVTAIAAGTAPITYRVINGCGTANAVHFVAISALPAIGASISGSPLACVGGTSEYSNPTGGGGGVWSSNNTSVATISSSTGTLTGISAGVVTISYVKTNGCGSSIATLVVTVLPLPVAGTISGTTPICSGTTSVFSSTESGGTWSSNYPAGATVSTTGVVTGITNGNFIISYRMTNSCGTAYASFPITVISVPALSTISGTATVCQAATTTLGNTISGGTWSSSNTAVATIATPTVGVVTGVATGTSTISYTASNTCGTSVVSRVVTVNSCARPGKTEGTGGSNSVFSVSPNPTTGVLNLTTSVAGVVVMYTIDGKELQQYEAKVGTTAITLPSGIASGVYMLRFTGADGSSRMTRLVYQQ